MKNTNRIGDFRVRLDILITTSDKGCRTQTPDIIDTMYLCSNTRGGSKCTQSRIKLKVRGKKNEKIMKDAKLFNTFSLIQRGEESHLVLS